MPAHTAVTYQNTVDSPNIASSPRFQLKYGIHSFLLDWRSRRVNPISFQTFVPRIIQNCIIHNHVVRCKYATYRVGILIKLLWWWVRASDPYISHNGHFSHIHGNGQAKHKCHPSVGALSGDILRKRN